MPVRAGLVYVTEKCKNTTINEARDVYLFDMLRAIYLSHSGASGKSAPRWTELIPPNTLLIQKQTRHRSKPKTFDETMDGILGKLG